MQTSCMEDAPNFPAALRDWADNHIVGVPLARAFHSLPGRVRAPQQKPHSPGSQPTTNCRGESRQSKNARREGGVNSVECWQKQGQLRARTSRGRCGMQHTARVIPSRSERH